MLKLTLQTGRPARRVGERVMGAPASVRLAGAWMALSAAALLNACAGLPAAPAAADLAAAHPATEWQAPLPHGGELRELARWWAQFNDPLLTRLIDSAESLSPSVATARSRIEQSRATRTAAGATLLPALNGVANASRGLQDSMLPLGSSAALALQTNWELDLYGGNHAARDAAQARLEGAQAGWHGARVAIAAEVANDYTALRACEAQLVQTRLDAASRAETARLTNLAAAAGFQSPANVALARASAAQGSGSATQQRARCDLGVKALVALTGMAEPALRSALAPAAARLPQPAEIHVPSVPAEALAQRPDIYAGARDVLAASSDVTQAEAQRYPRISLAGSIGAARFDSALGSFNGATWSIGPVAVSVPLFDGGTRRSNVVAARARYDAALLDYGGRLRGAVREVEEALIALQSTAERHADARLAVDGFETSYQATQSRYQRGLGSLFELEDARRSTLLAQSTLIDLQRERVVAWIALYRALGGGWDAAERAPERSPPPHPIETS